MTVFLPNSDLLISPIFISFVCVSSVFEVKLTEENWTALVN
jgi:hypothetical protein